MLDPRLAVFLAIAREGHLTRAARTLHRTQPAVSAQLRKLEDELDVRLFHRTAKGMELTEEGALFRRYVERAALWLDDGRRALEGLRDLSQGSLSIGAGATATTYLLPPLLRAYHQRWPGIQLQLREQGSAAVAEAVREGELDLGVVTLPVTRDAGLQFTSFVQDDLHLIIPENHPLAGRRRFSWSELQGQPMVMFEADTAVRRLIDGALDQAGVEVLLAMELRSIESIKQMVAQGIGAAFVSRFAVPTGTGLSPSDGDRLQRTLALCTRADREPSPATQAFLELATDASRTSG
jgi:DNA-binding transcriptional LysR family regulator